MTDEIQKRLDDLKGNDDFKKIEHVLLCHGFNLADEVLTGLPVGGDDLPRSGMFIYEHPNNKDSYCINYDEGGYTYIEASWKRNEPISVEEFLKIKIVVRDN